MSTAIEFRTAPRRAEPGRPPLRAVTSPARRRRPKLAYALTAVAGALAIAGAQMVLSVLTTQTSYEVAGLSQQQRELTWQKQILTDDVAGLSSPQYLAANASALGMVIAESPNYLRLSDGAVLGTGTASAPTSSIDALGRGSVANSLITRTPLITDPAATIAGVPVPTAPAGETVADSTTPAALTDGLPTPRTH